MSGDGEIRAAEWLAAWNSQGVHRTATAGDEAGADWRVGVAEQLGASPASEDFKLDRLDPVAAYLEIDDDRIAGGRQAEKLPEPVVLYRVRVLYAACYGPQGSRLPSLGIVHSQPRQPPRRTALRRDPAREC